MGYWAWVDGGSAGAAPANASACATSGSGWGSWPPPPPGPPPSAAAGPGAHQGSSTAVAETFHNAGWKVVKRAKVWKCKPCGFPLNQNKLAKCKKCSADKEIEAEDGKPKLLKPKSKSAAAASRAPSRKAPTSKNAGSGSDS